MLIDTRFNNGRWTQSIIIDILDEKLSGFFNMRGSEYPWSRQQEWFLGPKALLINEFNVSCGEEFPHRWRDLGLGPIFGRRTYGGEVGSSPGWPLVDGGVVSVPNYGMYTLKEGWIIEGEGVKPDVDVPSDPNAFVKGIDPQLDKAIAWLVEEARKNPRPNIKAPGDRVRVGGGS
jgi:tricorn protease